VKIYGNIRELVALVFRTDGRELALKPHQSTTYTTNRDIELPPGDTNQVIVSETATQTLTNKTLTSPAITTPTGITKSDVGLGNVDNTSDATKWAATATLTNKTIDGDNNTVQDLALSSLKTVLGDANEALVRDGSGAVTSALITNTNIDPAAAIAYSKLTLSGSIVNADVATGAAIVYSKLALSGSIVNADVATGAAIAYSKLNLSNSIVTGDLTDSAVTNAKLAGSIDISKLATFSSSDLAGRLTDETGSGAVVFGTSPSLATPALTSPTIATGATFLNQAPAVFRESTGGGSDAVSLSAPATLAASYSLELPGTAGSSGEVLTKGAGNSTTWTSPLVNPMDSTGDLIKGGSGGAAVKLDLGTADQVVKVNSAGTDTVFGTIVNASVDAAAAIAGTKISPAFGSQNVSTTGTLAAGSTTITNTTLGATMLSLSGNGSRTLNLLGHDGTPNTSDAPFVFSTGNSIRFDIDATPALFINSVGSIGIGNPTSITQALEINGGARATAYFVNNDTDTFINGGNSAGQLRINTDNIAVAQFSQASSGAIRRMQIFDTDGTNPQLGLDLFTDANGANFRSDQANKSTHLGVRHDARVLTVRGDSSLASPNSRNGNIGINNPTPLTKLWLQSAGGTYTNLVDNTTATMAIYNSSTTGSTNHASLSLYVNGVNAGDAFIAMGIDGGNQYSIGIDNSDGDNFKLANSSQDVATNTRMTITPAGRMFWGTSQNALVGSTLTDGLGASIYRPTSLNGSSDAIQVWYSDVGSTAQAKSFIRTSGGFTTDDTVVNTPADYAEFFEWADGNPLAEDRRGKSVVLVGNKIRLATISDAQSALLGIISVKPAYVGDAAAMEWSGKYLKNELGETLTAPVEYWQWVDEAGQTRSAYADEGILAPEAKEVVLVDRPVLNPDYDPSEVYVPREQRKEWSPVGLVGKLRLFKGQPTGDRWIKLRDISATLEEWLVR
jgi:hypothetical protein